MTREESSFYLANMDRRYMEDGMSEALDMAIEALEQEPSTDAVSRQAILDCKYSISDDEIGERKYVVDVTDIVELPPVTPKPKIGHWIDKDTYLECNRCGCLAPHTEFADAIFWKRSNYCPDCGARMESEDE